MISLINTILLPFITVETISKASASIDLTTYDAMIRLCITHVYKYHITYYTNMDEDFKRYVYITDTLI